MPITLTVSTLHPPRDAALLDTVARYLDGRAAAGQNAGVILAGGGGLAVDEGDGPGPATASGDRLEAALGRLHARGGVLTCLTRCAIGGAPLEIALLSDLHIMETGATLRLPDLLDEHLPCAGGWSRLMERAGSARAAGLLLGAAPPSGPMDAASALAAGLCDRIGEAGSVMDLVEPPADGASPTARRLLQELTSRAGRSAGLTPRQSRLLERVSFALVFSTRDPGEGIAAFFEGRPARFTGAPR